jgi:hypothetical protein
MMSGMAPILRFPQSLPVETFYQTNDILQGEAENRLEAWQHGCLDRDRELDDLIIRRLGPRFAPWYRQLYARPATIARI